MAAALAFGMFVPSGVIRPMSRSMPLQLGPPAVGTKHSSLADYNPRATHDPAAALSLLSAVVVIPMWRRKRTSRCLQTRMESVTPKTHVAQSLAQGLQTRRTLPVVGTEGCRSRHALRAFEDEQEDGPDRFFDGRKRTWNRKVVPAWNRYTSPTGIGAHGDRTGYEKAVFFFPAVDRKTPENNGWINPRMYKRRGLTKKMLRRARRDRKRAWRKLSNRLQDEYRFKRFPRDESGRVIQGTWGNKYHPVRIKMQNK